MAWKPQLVMDLLHFWYTGSVVGKLGCPRSVTLWLKVIVSTGAKFILRWSKSCLEATILDGFTSFLVYLVLWGKALKGLFGDLAGQGHRSQWVQSSF